MAKEIYHARLDADYNDPYFDADERRVRSLPDGREIGYRYIHGGFRKKAVKFIFCLPERAEDFKGRFFQYLSPFPGPDEELASLQRAGADDLIAFSVLNGAIFVESNMGSAAAFGPNGDAQDRWKSSAAVAELCRDKTMELYGCPRPVGIVFGGSGGGYKTMACIENTDAWEGAVPYVIGSPVSLPNTIVMHANGQRVLRNAFGKIVDALDAGGSGDPYAELNQGEADMLQELTDMGFPPIAWFLEANGIVMDGSLPVLIPGVKQADSSYFSEFWTVPGYAGAVPESTACRDRLQFAGVVKGVHLPGAAAESDEIDGRNGVDDAWQKMLSDGKDAWIELEKLPEGENLYLKGVSITLTSGEAKGSVLTLGDMKRFGEGGVLLIGQSFGVTDLAGLLAKIRPGDTLTLDNSDYIAFQYYYRHQVPADLSFHAWDQFRKADGTPAIPQRAFVIGYGFSGTGTVQDGDIQGKVINLQALMDESTTPWCADWYRNKVVEAGHGDEHRVYYMQRCLHGDWDVLENNMVVNYVGARAQALLDMAAWIQEGKEPLPSTVYECVGGQIEVAVPEKRRGIQPDVRLTANGEKCCRVKSGEAFTLRAEVTVPEGAGVVTSVRYGFDNYCGFPDPRFPAFPVEGSFESTEKGAVSELRHSYDKPGTYFAAVRVTAQRKGDASDVFTQIKNLDRVRIIVE